MKEKKAYEKDKRNLKREIDSLLTIKIIETPAPYAHRFFNGKDYQDTIKRTLAINLPPEITFTKIFIDTLFYLEKKDAPVSGFFIGKYNDIYGIRYHAAAFTYNYKKEKKINFLNMSSSSSEKEYSIKSLKNYYLHNRFKEDGKYNINDIRFYQ